MTRQYTWARFASHLGVLVVLFGLANVVVYRTVGYFTTEREYQQNVESISSHTRVRTVFAGDSHVAHPLNGFLNADPNSVAYSVAAGGDSLRESFAKLRYVLDHAPQVDTIVMSADPHMFGHGRLDSSNRGFADKYFILARDGSGLRNGWLSALLSQVPLFNDDFLQYLRELVSSHLPGAHRGVKGAPGPLWSGLSETQRYTIASATGAGDHTGIGDLEEPFTWYRRILDLARERNVRVIGVRYPVHWQYSAWARPDKVARIDERLRAAGLKDYVDLHDAIKDPAQFDDADHLNTRAAPVVLQMLEERLRRPLLTMGTAQDR
jgi:hypothetical protein